MPCDRPDIKAGRKLEIAVHFDLVARRVRGHFWKGDINRRDINYRCIDDAGLAARDLVADLLAHRVLLRWKEN